MKLVDLNVTVRDTRGNNAARRLRAAGQVPAIIYGTGNAISIAVAARELEAAIKDTNTTQIFVRLADSAGVLNGKQAILKELQRDPVTKNMLHADFHEIDMDKKIKAKAPVFMVGKPAGIDLGAVLKLLTRELDIVCSPNDVPDKIEINTADMKLGETMLAGSIDLGDKIVIATEARVPVVTLVPPKRAEGE